MVVGPTPSSLANPTRDEGFMQMAPGEFLAIIDDVGRMHVTAQRVTIEPAPGHGLAEMDYLVYGWAPTWIRILRQEFALHASAVVAGEWAFAVMGFSGAGKSTTATALTRRGYHLLIDDVLPVDLVDDVPHVHGWIRPVHLTDEAAAHFDIRGEARVGVSPLGKLAAELPSVGGSWPLRAAIELWPDANATKVSTQRLVGGGKMQAILNNANGSGLASADGRAPSLFEWSTRLAQRIDVYRVTRPATGWHLDTVVEQVIGVIGTIDD